MFIIIIIIIIIMSISMQSKKIHKVFQWVSFIQHLC